PGLPERPTEVMAVLQDVLGRKPGEPHARVYLGLIRMYRGEEIDAREFAEPLAIFEQKRFPPDLFLGQMAFIERSCWHGIEIRWTCAEVGPLVQQANALAKAIGDPSLLRLAAIARMRWSFIMLSYTEARRAEKDLDSMVGDAPPWLQVLE